MSYTDTLAKTGANLRGLRKAIPDTFAGFVALEQAASVEGALDAKQKEFVALGIAVALRCEDCILSHAAALHRLGASRDEIGQVLGTAVQMAGGPGLMYAAKALAAFDEFAGTGD